MQPTTLTLIQELQIALEATTIFTIPPHYERWEDGFPSLDTARKTVGEIKVRLEHAKDAPRWLLSDLSLVHGQLAGFVPLRDDFFRQYPSGGNSHDWTSLKSAERALDELQRAVAALKNNIRLRMAAPEDDGGLTRKTQQILAFSFGVAFVVALLLLAFLVKEPTSFQYTTFRVVLALAAAGVAAMIPGFLEVTVADWLRAGGALGVFVVVYFNNPAALVVNETREPDPTALFSIALACKTNSTVTIDTYSFPYADIKKTDKGQGIVALIAQLPSQRCKQDAPSIFRVKDEGMVGVGTSPGAADGGNLGIISIPKAIVGELGGNHIAFTKVNSLRMKQ
jgi:hypothetical protein